MFDLDQAVHRYARAVSTSCFRRNAQIVELEDHLHCEIERLVANGLSPEEAFLKAILKLGQKDALQQEFQKSRQRRSNLTAFNQLIWQRTRIIGLARTRLAIAAALLAAMVPAVVILRNATASSWTFSAFEACYAVSVRIIGLFG